MNNNNNNNKQFLECDKIIVIYFLMYKIQHKDEIQNLFLLFKRIFG